MRGVVLAGGLGTRLSPLTDSVNKHAIEIAGRPMVHYALDRAWEACGGELLLVVGGAFPETVVRAGESWSRGGGGAVSFVEQDGAGGVAAALACADGFALGGPDGEGEPDTVCVVLGDNLFGGSLAGHASAFEAAHASGDAEGWLVLGDVGVDAAAGRYGVASFAGEAGASALVGVDEKPERPASGYAALGAYFYGPGVFSMAGRVGESDRGEKEISAVNDALARRGALGYGVFDGWWVDAGTVSDLERAERLIAERGWGV